VNLKHFSKSIIVVTDLIDQVPRVVNATNVLIQNRGKLEEKNEE
jgi:hypothetical protein